jgi:hypothetical protein
MATEFQWRQKQFQMLVTQIMYGPSSFFRVILLQEFKNVYLNIFYLNLNKFY